MIRTGAEVDSPLAQRPAQTRRTEHDHSLDLVRHALHCVEEALASVARAAETLSRTEDDHDRRACGAPRGGENLRGGNSAGERWLTRQERRVLTLIAAGLSNREIAHDLEISDKTAKNYVHTVLVKLDAASRTEAAFTALCDHLVDPDECRRARRRTSTATHSVPRQRGGPPS